MVVATILVLTGCSSSASDNPSSEAQPETTQSADPNFFAFDSAGFPEAVRKVFEDSWAQVNAYSYPSSNVILETYVQETVPVWHSKIILAGADIMFKKYGAWYRYPEKPIYFVVATDSAWAEEALDSIGEKVGATSKEVTEFKSRMKAEKFRDYQVGAPATGLNGELNDHVVQVFESWVGYQPHAFDPHNSTHELWHPLTDGKYGLATPVRLGVMPCWLREGQASLVGDVVGIPNGSFEQYLAVMMSHGDGWRSEENVWAGNLEEDINGWCGDRGEYQDGDTIFTLLVGLHGWEKSVEFTDIPEELQNDWKKHFKNVYGFPVEDFYTEIEPLMVDFQTWAKSPR